MLAKRQMARAPTCRALRTSCRIHHPPRVCLSFCFLAQPLELPLPYCKGAYCRSSLGCLIRRGEFTPSNYQGGPQSRTPNPAGCLCRLLPCIYPSTWPCRRSSSVPDSSPLHLSLLSHHGLQVRESCRGEPQGGPRCTRPSSSPPGAHGGGSTHPF